VISHAPFVAGLFLPALLAAPVLGAAGTPRHAPARAGDGRLSVRAERQYERDSKIVFEASYGGGTDPKVSFTWDVSPEVDAEERGATCYVWAKPGTYRVLLTATDWTAQTISRTRFTFSVKGEGPTPPTPPGPGPGPNPPVPPGPTPGVGMKVLVTYESADTPKLTAAQWGGLQSATFRALLNSKCDQGPDGKTREWRVWDKDTDASAAGGAWPALMKEASGATQPAIVIADGKGVVRYKGPLPATLAEMVALVNKYAPAGARRKAA
jgi:hypothetical protein